MSEKKGTLTVHVLGTTTNLLPLTLVGAQVKIYDASEVVESKEGQQIPSTEKCVATGITGANGLHLFHLPEGEYRASATFDGDETPFPNKIHVCEGASIDVTINVPTEGITVSTSQTHCESDYAASDLCHLFYKRPTYVKFFDARGLVKRFALAADGATIRSLRSPGSNTEQPAAYFSVTPTGSDVLMRAAASETDIPLDPKVSPDDPSIISRSAEQPDVRTVEGDLSVSLKRSASFETRDIALWSVIRRAHDAISFDRYMDFMNWIFCEPRHHHRDHRVDYSANLKFVNKHRFLPFTDTDAYRNIKAATEAFLMANACVHDTAKDELSYIADHVAINKADLRVPEKLFDKYTAPDKMLPYLAVIRAKLSDQRLKDRDIDEIELGGEQASDPDDCYGILREKLTCPCLLELIWSYWNEEGMLVQTMNVITRRFQNMRGPLACFEVARKGRASDRGRLTGHESVQNILIGESLVWRSLVRKLVEIGAFSSGNVLIVGETGTGKELMAEVLHVLDSRSPKPDLVVVDCTTLSPELSGSELFGHERGAFTGAIAARDGAFALANGGTLLLDEIGELPLPLQAQLLRVIQERTYKRVGGNTWHKTEFRLISATNRDLEQGARDGTFRADLYYRLAD